MTSRNTDFYTFFLYSFVNNRGNSVSWHSSQTKELVRKITEGLARKVSDCELAHAVFKILRTCIQENLFPKYSNNEDMNRYELFEIKLRNSRKKVSQ